MHRTGRQDGLEIVARKLGLRPVDDADRPLEQGLRQYFGKLAPLRATPVGQAAGTASAAERGFPAILPRGPHLLDLHFRAPV